MLISCAQFYLSENNDDAIIALRKHLLLRRSEKKSLIEIRFSLSSRKSYPGSEVERWNEVKEYCERLWMKERGSISKAWKVKNGLKDMNLQFVNAFLRNNLVAFIGLISFLSIQHRWTRACGKNVSWKSSGISNLPSWFGWNLIKTSSSQYPFESMRC